MIYRIRDWFKAILLDLDKKQYLKLCALISEIPDVRAAALVIPRDFAIFRLKFSKSHTAKIIFYALLGSPCFFVLNNFRVIETIVGMALCIAILIGLSVIIGIKYVPKGACEFLLIVRSMDVIFYNLIGEDFVLYGTVSIYRVFVVNGTGLAFSQKVVLLDGVQIGIVNHNLFKVLVPMKQRALL